MLMRGMCPSDLQRNITVATPTSWVVSLLAVCSLSVHRSLRKRLEGTEELKLGLEHVGDVFH